MLFWRFLLHLNCRRKYNGEKDMKFYKFLLICGIFAQSALGSSNEELLDETCDLLRRIVQLKLKLSDMRIRIEELQRLITSDPQDWNSSQQEKLEDVKETSLAIIKIEKKVSELEAQADRVIAQSNSNSNSSEESDDESNADSPEEPKKPKDKASQSSRKSPDDAPADSPDAANPEPNESDADTSAEPEKPEDDAPQSPEKSSDAAPANSPDAPNPESSAEPGEEEKRDAKPDLKKKENSDDSVPEAPPAIPAEPSQDTGK